MDFVAKSVVDRSGNTFIDCTMVGEKGRETHRVLAIDDFLSMMGQSIKREVRLVEIKNGFFPKDYVSLFYGDEEHYSCSFFVEPKKRVFVYSDGKHYNIPYPKLLFKVERDSYSLRGSVFALKSGKQSKKLYNYPFGNVNSSGGICMGNISLKDIEKVTDFADEFFLGVTNEDYMNSCKKVKPDYTQKQLLDKLVKLDEFPERWLVESSMSYADVVGKA